MEKDLCRGCGGGGPGVHHRSAGDRTLLVSFGNEIVGCCCQFFQSYFAFVDVTGLYFFSVLP